MPADATDAYCDCAAPTPLLKQQRFRATVSTPQYNCAVRMHLAAQVADQLCIAQGKPTHAGFKRLFLGGVVEFGQTRLGVSPRARPTPNPLRAARCSRQ